MRLFLPLRRATLLIPTGVQPAAGAEHLFILLTDPVGEAQEVLLVNISSVKANMPHDPTCHLFLGDHEFVTQQSYVVYSRAEIWPASKLVRGVESGLFAPKGTLSTEIMARVCAGLENSRHTKPRVLEFYRAATQPSADDGGARPAGR